MKRIFMIFVTMMLTGCVAVNETPTPTPEQVGIVSGAVELIQQDMALRLTQQSIEQERLETAAKMTATQQVIDAQVTQEARRISAQGTSIAATAEHEVWMVTVQAGRDQATSTAAAQATATQQAVLGMTATVQAEATATASYETKQAPIVAAQNTAVMAQAQSAELAAKRERMTNDVLAWGPWVIALAAAGVLGFVLVRKSSVGTIEPDENGLMPGMVIFHKGQKQIIMPDRLFGPVLTLGVNGTVGAPMLTDNEHQEGTTRRAQAVQAINALPPQLQQRGMSLMQQTFNPVQARNIEMLDAGHVKPWIDEVEQKLSEEL